MFARVRDVPAAAGGEAETNGALRVRVGILPEYHHPYILERQLIGAPEHGVEFRLDWQVAVDTADLLQARSDAPVDSWVGLPQPGDPVLGDAPVRNQLVQ